MAHARVRLRRYLISRPEAYLLQVARGCANSSLSTAATGAAPAGTGVGIGPR